MTVKEFLRKGRRLNSEILELTEARIKAFNSACGGAADTSGERVQTSKQNGSESKILSCVQYGAELEERIQELNRYRQNMLEIINRVESSECRSVLIAYYINCKIWEQVAADMGYSLRAIYRLHNKALLECKLLPSIERQQIKNI